MKENNWTREQLRLEFPQARDLQEILANVQGQAQAKGEVVCEISVNGIALTEEEEQRFARAGVDEIIHLKVKLQNPQVLLDESLNGCQAYLKQLLTAFENSAQLFRSEDIHRAHHYYKACIEGAQWFVEMVTHYKKAHQNLRGGLSVSWLELEQAMVLALEQILEAYERKNYILVADLLEYDLITIFDRWRQELSQLEQSRNRESYFVPEVTA